jgi:hypothetical protein
MDSLLNANQLVKEELTPMLLKLVHKIQGREYSFYEASIT